MTANDLKTAGYNVGNVNDAVVDRALAMVAACYIAPVLPDYDATDTDVVAAEMALVFIALTGVSTYATRAGGRMKLSPNLSERGYASQTDFDNADRLLRVLQTKTGAVTGELDTIVDDVLHLYMRTYFSLN